MFCAVGTGARKTLHEKRYLAQKRALVERVEKELSDDGKCVAKAFGVRCEAVVCSSLRHTSWMMSVGCTGTYDEILVWKRSASGDLETEVERAETRTERYSGIKEKRLRMWVRGETKGLEKLICDVLSGCSDVVQ